MAGFSGAVEEGARSIGIAVSLVAALVVGWVAGSFNVGLVVFVAGYVVALVWGHVAGARFRDRLLEDVRTDEGEEPRDPET